MEDNRKCANCGRFEGWNGCGEYVETCMQAYDAYSNWIPSNRYRCKLCEDLDRVYDIVCYIPTDSGGSIDLPVHYCPQCGRKLNT